MLRITIIYVITKKLSVTKQRVASLHTHNTRTTYYTTLELLSHMHLDTILLLSYGTRTETRLIKIHSHAHQKKQKHIQ